MGYDTIEHDAFRELERLREEGRLGEILRDGVASEEGRVEVEIEEVRKCVVADQTVQDGVGQRDQHGRCRQEDAKCRAYRRPRYASMSCIWASTQSSMVLESTVSRSAFALCSRSSSGMVRAA